MRGLSGAVPVYGSNSTSYVAQPNYAPVGTGGTNVLSCDSCPPPDTMCDPTTLSCPPIGTGGSPSPGQATGSGPQPGAVDPSAMYVPDFSSLGAGIQAGSVINVVTEGESGISKIFSGTTFGLPSWLVYLAGAGLAYQLLKGKRS